MDKIIKELEEISISVVCRTMDGSLDDIADQIDDVIRMLKERMNNG